MHSYAIMGTSLVIVLPAQYCAFLPFPMTRNSRYFLMPRPHMILSSSLEAVITGFFPVMILPPSSPTLRILSTFAGLPACGFYPSSSSMLASDTFGPLAPRMPCMASFHISLDLLPRHSMYLPTSLCCRCCFSFFGCSILSPLA